MSPQLLAPDKNWNLLGTASDGPPETPSTPCERLQSIDDLMLTTECSADEKQRPRYIRAS